MKKIFNSILFGLTAVALTSCSDVAEEITSVTYARNFSPTSVEAKVRNRTNVELSWNLGDGIIAYNIEVFANDSLTFAGSPVKTLTVAPEEIPVLITGLEGETKYSFRVQATDGNTSRDSKWSGAYAKTDAEQLFKNVAEEDIKHNQVTLRWTAGEKAATITLTPGNIVYNITDADIAAGAATITGLTPETDYKAVMARANGATRGQVTFRTGIEMAETDILIKNGDDLAAAIAKAPAGYRLILMPGTYSAAVGEDGTVGKFTVTKNLSLKGLKAAEHPVIKGRFEVEASLDIDQCTIDGTKTDGSQAFNFTADGEIDHLNITKSEIKNYTKGFYYLNKATLVKTINIENCIISDIECSGGDFLDARKGGFNTLTIKNNTIANSAKSRDFIRMDDNSANVTAAANIIVDHNTLYNVGSDNGNYRIFYVRWKSGNKITFTNNIVVGTNYKRGFANQATTDKAPTLENNVYFNTVNLISAGATADATISWFDTKGVELDPQFKDAAKGDFTVGNDNVKDTKAGDPRWLK